jgi:hypothetical protein
LQYFDNYQNDNKKAATRDEGNDSGEDSFEKEIEDDLDVIVESNPQSLSATNSVNVSRSQSPTSI